MVRLQTGGGFKAKARGLSYSQGGAKLTSELHLVMPSFALRATTAT